jgi:nitroreductase
MEVTVEVFEAIRTLLAIREYRSEPIPDEVASRIVEAGRLTGSARNRQPWDFIVVRDPDTLRRLGELASTGPYIAKAPLAIAVVVPESPNGYVDGARATQDMMLAAWAEGVGSNWVGNTNTGAIKELLGVPQERMVLNIIPFGYPVQEVGRGIKNRKPLDQVAHAERYGNPFRA